MEWTEFDKNNLSYPLYQQSGGWFFVLMDGGIHGKMMQPVWWTGERFYDCNNEIITHFMKIEFPKMPDEKERK